MNKFQKIIIIISVIIFIVILCLFIMSESKKNKVKKVEPVKYEVAEKLYKDIDKEKSTSDKKYVSKLYGYSTSSEGIVTMNTKEGYIKDNKVYDLNDKYIGEYNKDKINDILEQGTTKTYKFKKESDKYVEIK